MPVSKICEQCGCEYFRPPSVAKRSKFCSVACRNDADRTLERRMLVCESCGAKFVSVMDHGVWPKFCTRACFERGAVQPAWKKCPACDSMFLAKRSSHPTADGLRIYCSIKCKNAGARTGITRECVYCGKEFYLSQSRAKYRNADGCCSHECQLAFYVNSNSPAWKGGAFVSAGGEKFLVSPRQLGRIKSYVGEHRVIASQAIGRPLLAGEVVLRINRTPSDNRPENLFVCESNSEFSKRRNGSLPWPSYSNLPELATKPT